MRRSSPSSTRAGYTLVELLLALAVIAVLAGITLPSAMRMLSTSRLSEVTEQVRLQLAGTRMRAIESGLAYQFRFEPDGRSFVSVPYEREFEGSNGNATGTGMSVGVGTFTRFSGKLPDGYHFNACCTTGTGTTQEISAEAFGDLPDADKLSSIGWSAPLIFLADGSGVDGAFEVVDPQGQAIRLEVRGLTGATTVGRPGQETPK